MWSHIGHYDFKEISLGIGNTRAWAAWRTRRTTSCEQRDRDEVKVREDTFYDD